MSGSSAGFDSSPSSSTDSTSPGPSFSDRRWTRDLSSNLKLGLSISWPSCDICTKHKNRNEDDEQPGRPSFLFVKVYMEGMPIGRKLDLYALHSYNDLLETLSNMFGISIYSARLAEMEDSFKAHLFNYSMLIYKDTDGDWMMVGDVPWELFLTTVKRLKITNPHCGSLRTRNSNGVS